jgi:hypothetical protein
MRLPKYLRYRLALAVLPSLAWARARFVARIVHRDPAGWSAAVADLIRWHGSARDEAAEWPGRAAQESQISAAGGDGGDGGADSAPDDTPGEPATDDVAAGAKTAGQAASEPGARESKPSGIAG